MTEEEIRPIAENYVEEYCHCSDGEYTDGSLVCAGIGTALIVSRQLEKRIEEIENYFVESAGYGRDKVRNFMDIVDKALEQKGERIATLEQENAELKEYNKYLRRKRQGGIQKQYNKVATIKQQDDQLTKAKEIIKKFSEFVNNEIEYDPEHPQEHTDLWNKLCEESEEFLKENEK